MRYYIKDIASLPNIFRPRVDAKSFQAAIWFSVKFYSALQKALTFISAFSLR